MDNNELTDKKPQNRQANGKFAKGYIANPGGRPKIPEELKELCKVEGLGKLKHMLSNFDTYKEQTQIELIKICLDRYLGKAPQQITSDQTGEITVTVKYV